MQHNGGRISEYNVSINLTTVTMLKENVDDYKTRMVTNELMTLTNYLFCAERRIPEDNLLT